MKKFIFALSVLLSTAIFFGCTTNAKSKKQVYTGIIVTSEFDGLHFAVTHKANEINLNISVYCNTDEAGNLDLYYQSDGVSTSENFIYPFVTYGKTYTVTLNSQDSSWTTISSMKVINVYANGGSGDYRVLYNGIVYDGTQTLNLPDYQRICPESEKERGELEAGAIYYNSSYNSSENVWSWSNSYGNVTKSGDKDTGEIVLSDTDEQWTGGESSITRLKNLGTAYFWTRIYFHTTIDDSGVCYQSWDSRLSDVFQYGETCSYLYTEGSTLKVKESKTDGICITNNLSDKYTNVRIHVKDVTAGVYCPTLILGADYETHYYPFTVSGNKYEIYTQAWDSSWGNYYKSESVNVTAESGCGDAYISTTGATYDSSTNKITLNGYSLTYPSVLGKSNVSVSGNIGYTRKENPSDSDFKTFWKIYSFADGVIDISEAAKRIIASEFYVQLAYTFSCNGNSYELTLIDNKYGTYFTDTNTLPDLIFNTDYQLFDTYGTYTVDETQQNKKAFLIKYNTSSSHLADAADTSSNVIETLNARSAAASGFTARFAAFEEPVVLCGTPEQKLPLDLGEELSVSENKVCSENNVLMSAYSEYKVGSTKKTFNSTSATLKAIGEHCNVWYYNNNSTADEALMDAIKKGKVSFQGLADRFDKMFELETYIIGSNVPEKTYSNIITVDSSTKIDILIFDLNNDYTGKETGGTFGYFYSGDMFTGGNESEMINIDSAFLGLYPSTMYGTLAHEFQHLLHFVNKHLNKKISSDTWFNEFMSLATEDVLREYIDGSTGIENRVYPFNSYYYKGFEDWSANGESPYGNYGTAALFADYLMKNYGGIDLLYQMAHNNFVNEESVVDAVHTMGYTDETFDTLMEKFGITIACAGYDEDKAVLGITAKKSASKTYTVNNTDYTCVLEPLDLTTASNANNLYWGSYSATQWVKNNTAYGPLIFYGNQSFSQINGKTFGVKYLGENLSEIEINDPGDNYQLAVVFAE